MASEELIVLLDAKTAKLDAKLNSTNEKLDKLDVSTKKTDKSFLSFGKAGSMAATGIATLATAALAVNAAISAMVLSAANNRKELELLSTQAKTSTEDFQALAFATGQYGIDAAKIADASKDISDRIGEFSAAGTGVFQDYADAMKLSKDEARSAAKEFEGLGSQEILGTMVSRMENANVSGDKMLFVMESLANDASKLIPLFANNSKELLLLKDRFNDVNSSLSITAGQAEGLKEVSTSYTLMTSQLGNAATAISATIAPVMDDFFNDVISIVPEATQTIIDFANSFLDAENISSQAGVLKEIAASQSRLVELENRLAEAKERTNKGGSGLVDTAEIQIGSARLLIEQEKIRTEELNAQLTVLEGQQIRLENVNSLKGGEIGGLNGAGVDSSGLGTGDEIQAIADRFKTEEELLFEKLEREREIIGEDKELRLELENEFIENMIAIDEKYTEEKEKIKEDAAKKELKAATSAAKQEAKIEASKAALANRVAQTLLSDSMSTHEKLFSIVKDAAAGQIEAYGLTAAARSLAELGPIAGPPVAASQIAWSQVAAGIVRAIPLGGGGGGGGSSVGSASATGSSQEQAQQSNFEADTTSLRVTDSTSSGSGQSVITFATDSGDELIDAIAKALNKGNSDGRF